MTVTFRTTSCLFAVVSCSVAISCVAANFDSKDFQADASFDLVVLESTSLAPGTSRIQAQGAFVSLVHGLVPGNSDGLEVMFLTRPITEATLPEIMNNDARELMKSDYAAMVLFLDKEHRVWQVNVSYVVPGTTVARTVAWRPDELRKYFSHVSYRDGRLILKSTGSYVEGESGQEALRLTWAVDLDLPVIREITR